MSHISKFFLHILASSSDNDGQDSARIVKNIKKEPSKTPSPEKSIHRKPQGKGPKSSISFKDETDLKLPPIDKQIDELISRYSQSSDTDVSSSPTRKKRKTVFKPNNDLTKDKSSPKPTSSAYRPPTPIPKKDKSLPSDSDEEEMEVDVDSSISNLLNKVKQENFNKRKTKNKSS